MELYYAIVNILDYLAKNELEEYQVSKFMRIIDKLAGELVRIGWDESIQDAIESIADANDAGGCKTWKEIVETFRELYKTGERIEIGSEFKEVNNK